MPPCSLITLATALFINLETAIYVGIGVALVLFLRKTSTPSLVEYTFSETGHLRALPEKSQRLHPQISIIHVEGRTVLRRCRLVPERGAAPGRG